MKGQPILSDDDKRAFMRDGYIVLRGIVPAPMTAAALQVADEAFSIAKDAGDAVEQTSDGMAPHFTKEARRHPAVVGIINKSGLYAACEELLGKGNVFTRSIAQIAFRGKDPKFTRQGMSMTEDMPAHCYHIDAGAAKTNRTASPFSLLVGVCLSPNQHVDENRGQFNVWPGSHVKLHPVVWKRVQQGLGEETQMFGGPKNKPDIGLPRRLLMRPGDAVIAHQRLGHSGGINLHEEIRKNLYFRVAHKRHAELVPTLLTGSVYTECEGLHHLLDEYDASQ